MLGVGLLDALDDLERQQAHDLGNLRDHAHEAVVDDVDLVDAAVGGVAQEHLEHRVADLLGRLELGVVGAAGPLPLGRAATEL